MAPSQRCAVPLLVHLLLLFSSVLATPFQHNISISAHNHNALARLYSRQGGGKPFYLRIMPLGASITAGYGTNPQNGYRKPLRDQLRWEGWPVNMVGSQSNGDPVNFKDQQHEGHPGWVVANMTTAAMMSIDMKPNVILLNCGTNDANPDNHQDVANTANRMESLLNFLYGQVDGVTIILSTLIPYLEDVPNQNVDIINAGYRDLYQRFRGQGKKIGLAELNNGFLDTTTDYFDHIHPNEKGAAKLAAVWDQAIAEVEAAGFLSSPIDTGVSDESNSGCDPQLGQGRGPIKTQQGSGEDDGPFYYNQGSADSDLASNGFFDVGTKVSFAQLVNLGGADPGSEFDEVVYCYDETDTNGNLIPGNCLMIINDGGDTSGQEVVIDVGLKCLTRGHRWGDVNGDDLDDFICIGPDGNMYVAINRGGNPPTFEPLENGGLIKPGFSWAPQDRIRLGDIDGDGRLDYCAIDDKGDIYCWRNGGVGDAPTATYNGYWQSFVVGEPTFFAQHEADGIGGVNLVDINGDGRSDWVYLHKNASSTIFINQRGDDDADGKSLRPHWEPAAFNFWGFYPLFGSGPGSSNVSELVFGRVKGSGRADLIWNRVTPGENKGDLSRIAPLLFENTGSGGTKLKGDGVFYCDMFGRGRDDYLWVKSDGHITLYENILSPPNWGQHGEIIFIDRDRKSIHFGDWDGDGLCDILAVERHTGRVEWWRNTYQQGDASPTFDGPEWAVDQGQCDLGWGRGLYDQALRFGDLDGDGRVDYLCMEKDARTVGYLNKPGGLESQGQIKFAPAGPLDRANFKWADVNGDGKVDLIWVDKFTAEARVWKNGGFTPSGGSSMTWIDQGVRFDGHGRGQNIHFANLGGLGRADYIDVYPHTSVANTWFNECGGGGDDYPTPINPNLPTPPSGSGDGTGDGGDTGTGDGGDTGTGDDDADFFDDTDLSFIVRMAAIGDSYSAGIGAGDRLGNVLGALDPKSDYACSRYAESYPMQIHGDPRLGDPASRTFQFKSCSGAVIQDVLDKQIPDIDAGQQVILLSAGGNDAELVNILNQCIFQWAAINPEQLAVIEVGAKAEPQYEWLNAFDWETLGRGCEGQLAKSKSIIESSDFSDKLDSVLTAAKAKLASDGVIYYTGYAKFFDESLTTECDNVSWTTWIYKTYNSFQSAEKLTRYHRQLMNNLVDEANSKLADAVARAGPQVVFVNYDKYVGEFGGRYCLPGVDESTTASNTRVGLMFYEMNTFDPLGTTPWKRDVGDTPLANTFMGQADVFATITLLADPDANFAQQEARDQAPLPTSGASFKSTAMVSNHTTSSVEPKVLASSDLELEVPNLLPDGYGRVFHPQILLHALIADLVIYEMTSRNSQLNGFEPFPENFSFTTCPAQ